MNYQKGEGYYMYRGHERYSGRLNNDWQISKWLKANVDLDFSLSEFTSPANNSVVYWAYIAAPIYGPYWEDGRYADVKDGANPLAGFKEGGISKGNYYRLGGKIQFDITPFKDF
jgi:hypothetical protein